MSDSLLEGWVSVHIGISGVVLSVPPRGNSLLGRLAWSWRFRLTHIPSLPARTIMKIPLERRERWEVFGNARPLALTSESGGRMVGAADRPGGAV